jgi:hypothetical protein
MFGHLPPGTVRQGHSAYVEWFSVPKMKHAMFVVSQSIRGDGSQETAIIPVEMIQQTCQVILKFGKQCDWKWTSNNVLEWSLNFYINNFADNHSFQTIW